MQKQAYLGLSLILCFSSALACNNDRDKGVNKEHTTYGESILRTADNQSANGLFKHPFYAGLMGGYGSTTWQGLVPSKENSNMALSISTPIEAEEGGGVWGLFLGYELAPFFAIEANYIHYPAAIVTFDELSLFSFSNDNLTNLDTQTQTANLMGKIMMFLPRTNVRIYSSAGVAEIFRNDMLLTETKYSPTFGAGINYKLNNVLMLEIAGNYTAGFGESQLNPAETFFPFLYSVMAKAALCFG